MLAQAVNTLDQVIKSLAAAGPLALVLGVAVFALWRSNAEERTRHSLQEEAERAAIIVSHDTARREYLAAAKVEADRHAIEEEKVRAELVGVLKKLTGKLE